MLLHRARIAAAARAALRRARCGERCHTRQ